MHAATTTQEHTMAVKWFTGQVNGKHVHRIIQGVGRSGSGMTSGASLTAGSTRALVHAMATYTGAALCGRKVTAEPPRWATTPASGHAIDLLTCPKCRTLVS